VNADTVAPGAIVLTRIFLWAPSMAAVRLRLATAAFVEHLGQRRLHAVEGTLEVDGDHAIEFLFGHVHDHLVVGHPRDVAHHVEPSVVGHGTGDERVEIGPHRDVAPLGDRRAAAVSDRSGCRLGSGVVDVTENELGADGAEELGRGLADAAPGTGQHGHLGVESE